MLVDPLDQNRQQMVFGKSKTFQEFVETLDLFAPLPWAVLIQGETGTGKELLARRVHRGSGRRQFFPVNCAALPATLMESELFGHTKGAFSGASHAQPGIFRQADGGTVFLDEIGEMPLPLQSKLLRLLDTGEVRPVGSPHCIQVQVRVIAATNVDLAQAVEEKTFRQDLFERLHVLPLTVPPLRERREDIGLIVGHFAGQLGLEVCPLALQRFQQAPWPGNVRQLRNVLLRARAQGGPVLGPELTETLLKDIQISNGKNPYQGTLADIEKRVIVDRIRRCSGNRKQAAKELGIAKSTLHEKLRRWREDRDPAVGQLGWRPGPWTGQPNCVVV